jgi:hypothetical protein
VVTAVVRSVSSFAFWQYAATLSYMNDPETYIVVPTHRLRDVSETIHEYDEHFWWNGHSPQMIVFDDPTNVENYFTYYYGSILVREQTIPSGASGRVSEICRRSCLYDAYEKAALWGKDLYQHLSDIYQKKARFCIIFASGDYAKKTWTTHELKSAQARASLKRVRNTFCRCGSMRPKYQRFWLLLPPSHLVTIPVRIKTSPMPKCWRRS